MTSDIGQRKQDHLALCATDDVAFRTRTTLLECVSLMHRSLPELDADAISLETDLCGRRLRAPIVIAGMTGGTAQAARVNQTLAAVAEERGYAFGLGSQRAMLKRPELRSTYLVRDVAPTAFVLGNIGIVQARETATHELAELVRVVGADALCVHMNPAMELIQPGGDRDFRGGLETLARLVDALGVPVIAKETGNGISHDTAVQLAAVGVRSVDVSGAGGTSWVGVEALRAEARERALGEAFWDWGVPTAASVAYAKRAGLEVIATGGIRTGLDVARAIALGASAAGVARLTLQAFNSGGRVGVEEFLAGLELELRTAMVLTASPTIAALQRARRIVRGELRDWLSDA